MDNIVPLLYLSILSISLLVVSFFIVRQIIARKEIEDTLSVLQNKIRSNEADAQDYYELGSIYLSKKLFDQAILQFRYALQIWKNEDLEGISNLYNTIGFTYAETEQYELAIYYYKEALKNDSNYIPMSKNFDKSIAFKASVDLVLEGDVSPSGYTEPILHKSRLELKSTLG